MDILMLGATGRTGHRAVNEALAKGHDVTALVRRSGSAPEGTAELVGDATDETLLKEALSDKDALLIALAGSPQQGYEVLSQAAEAAVKAMQPNAVTRVVTIGQSSILEADDGDYRGKNLAPEFRPIFAAHLAAYKTYAKSGLDWTILCPANLPDGDYTGDFEWEIEALPKDLGFTAYTGDVAHLMIDVLDRPETFGKRLGVVSRVAET
jgi:uncharacterized protein